MKVSKTYHFFFYKTSFVLRYVTSSVSKLFIEWITAFVVSMSEVMNCISFLAILKIGYNVPLPFGSAFSLMIFILTIMMFNYFFYIDSWKYKTDNSQFHEGKVEKIISSIVLSCYYVGTVVLFLHFVNNSPYVK